MKEVILLSRHGEVKKMMKMKEMKKKMMKKMMMKKMMMKLVITSRGIFLHVVRSEYR